MLKKILVFILIFNFFQVSPAKSSDLDRIYFISLDFLRGDLFFNEVYITNGRVPGKEPEYTMSPYRYRIALIGFDGKILDERTFSIQNEVASAPPPEEGEEYEDRGPMILEELEHIVILPYYPNGSSLLLFNVNNQLVDQFDISQFAEVCGDGVCADYENYLLCPEDCAPDEEDGYCNKESLTTDPDCLAEANVEDNQKISKEEKNEKQNMFFIFLFTLPVLVIFGVAIFYWKRKKTYLEQ